MTQYIVRLAAADDRPEVLRLQEQFVAELADPLGVAEGSHEHSEFVLIEAVDEQRKRAIGITSLMRASSAPFVCEQVFPDLWEKIDLCASTGQSSIRRDDLAENDWGYVEKEHRGTAWRSWDGLDRCSSPIIGAIRPAWGSPIRPPSPGWAAPSIR